MKDGTEVLIKYIIRGPEYYMIAARGTKEKNNFSSFFDSFRFTDYRYNGQGSYVDTFMHFSVATPVKPELDNGLRRLIEKAAYETANANNSSGYISYWPKTKNGLFKSDSTGELISVSIQEYPKYYYVKDPANFWKDQLDTYYKSGMEMYGLDSVMIDKKKCGLRFSLRDTGSSRTISRMILVKGNCTYSLACMGDTLHPRSAFAQRFFDTFQPVEKLPGKNIFDNRLDEFFSDLFSKDSALHALAQRSISNIYFGEKGIPGIMEAINKLNISDKYYFDTRTKLIAELGYIKDTLHPRLVEDLRKIYKQTVDTSMFQNEVLKALARRKTKESYTLFKELILQDPPLFEDKYDYTSLFSNLYDSLQLTKPFFPELLQLSSLDDYKENVMTLLVRLVDSSLISATDYESYFSKIYFDARIELKKQQGKDEKQMEEDSKKDDNDSSNSYNSKDDGNPDLKNYEILLVPFYEKNENVQRFFAKLLQSKDPYVRMGTAVVLLRNNKPVADSILQKLAASDQFRGELFNQLETAKRLDRFPAKYKDQLDIARSYLVEEKDYGKIDSVVFIKKQPAYYPGKKGVVYFFKYRVKKEDDWKIGIGGLQPENEKEVSSDDKLTIMTDKKLKASEPQDDQLNEQLKKILFNFHKSGKYFYSSDNYYDRYRTVGDYED